MKVAELINELNEIGYDENTELFFSCINEEYLLDINYIRCVFKPIENLPEYYDSAINIELKK